MTKDEILQFEPPAARLLGREVISIDTVAGGATLRYKVPGGDCDGDFAHRAAPAVITN